MKTILVLLIAVTTLFISSCGDEEAETKVYSEVVCQKIDECIPELSSQPKSECIKTLEGKTSNSSECASCIDDLVCSDFLKQVVFKSDKNSCSSCN